MNIRILHAAATALAVILALQPAGGLAQGVPTIDLTSIAKIGEVLTEATRAPGPWNQARTSLRSSRAFGSSGRGASRRATSAGTAAFT